MEIQENETVEFKRVFVDDINKEIIAFANSSGGKLYIGIADEGNVEGLVDPDDTIQRIANKVRDSIKPDLTMFIHLNPCEINGKKIVVVDVQRGTNRPYYLSHKGLRPEGVYVRQGTTSAPASDAYIRQMIKETDGDRFEDMRSIEQDLTFESAKAEFRKRNVEFGKNQMETLGILNTDNIFTNLGLLLSDQCPYSIKVAIFQDSDQSAFIDRREFSGSLLSQMNEVYTYIDLINRTRSTFEKLRRVDTRDYPEVALREALLNAIIHRDYSFSASALISIYENRVEFVSVGGLLSGIFLEDILLGLSICCNAKLANVFYRLQLIEAYGTGIRKILNAYQESGKTPLIENTRNAFKITLPNLNAGITTDLENGNSDREEMVLDAVRKQGAITRKEVETYFGIGQTTASRLIKRMIEAGQLRQEGDGKNTKYKLPD